jgi:AraC-like DNA-binding protein
MSTLNAPVLSLAMERQPLHKHAEARLIVFTAGGQSEETFDGVHAFGAGDVLFRPSYFAHANTTSERGAAYMHIELSAVAARAWFRKHGWRAGFAQRPFTSRQMLRLMGRRHFSAELLDIVCVRPEAPPLATDQRYLAAVQSVPVAEVARRCGLAPYEMSREFRRRHGCTPRSYRNMARLHQAIRMLNEGALGLSEIAQACDYFDQSHFNRSVKKETGLTPRALALASRG